MPEGYDIKAVLYAHGGVVFAFLDNHRPYSIIGEYSQLLERAKRCSSERLGNLTVKIRENADHPNIQAIAVLTDKRGVSRQAFEAMLPKLFPGRTIQSRWITNFQQENGHLAVALVGLRRLQQD